MKMKEKCERNKLNKIIFFNKWIRIHRMNQEYL